jgi:predicted acylesterase/phospholipase RssA/CRP-like cAMP-binding protein
VLRDIDAALEPVHVPGGVRIVRRGQTGVPLILIVHGGLRASFVDENGHGHVLFECFRGATVGEALVLTGGPSPLDVYAIRDSYLLCLSPERFSALAAQYPQLALSFARIVTAHLVEQLHSPDFLASASRKTDRLPRSTALVSVGGGRAQHTRDLLIEALSRGRTTTRLNVREARAAMGAGIREGEDVPHERLVTWLERLDARSDLVIFECEWSDSSWLDFCLRQVDRIMVLLDDEYGPSERETHWWRESKIGERAARVELAVVHRPSTDMPQAGDVYARLPGVARLHHVRSANPRDAERLARWLLDRPVGLVLGGGGAYGVAHVGVLKALEEGQVPVDTVGGTSMGALFAGGLALGWSADQMMEQVRRLFASRFALYDPTIPSSALLGGKKLDRVLQRFFQDFSIADMWIPFFSVATNISRARPQVHDRGSIRDAIRASCSIPGLFPPYEAANQLLVDGGLVNNLPIDIMRDRCRGPIIAVNVFPYLRHNGDNGGHKQEGFLDGLRARLKPLTLPLFDILMRSTFVGSQSVIEMSLSTHPPALYLMPDVEKFRILDWRAYQAIFRAGYDCAKRELDAGAFPRALWDGRVEQARI